MKILHLFPYVPSPPTFGGALRVYHILKHLSKNHDVTVGGFAEFGNMKRFNDDFPGVKGDAFVQRRRIHYRRLMQVYSLFTSHSYWYNWGQSPKLEAKVRALVAKEDFDIILGEFASMGHFDLETDAIRVMDAHNIEYDNFRRMSLLKWSGIRKWFYKREAEKCYSEEVKAFNRHDAIFATSERDKAIIEKDAPDIPKYVVPNGVDTDFFSPSETETEPFSMVFTGALSYVPNYDGMIYFLDEIFPIIQKVIPQAKIYVVGSRPPAALQKYQSNSVIVTGFVDDVRPYVDQASVFVVPLKMGSGTRLKVVEALSMKKPVVSTSIGCEGIDVTDGRHLLVRDEPATFAEAVINLFQDFKLRNHLIENGYQLVKNKYDWRVIGDSINDAFQQLTSNKDLLV